MYIIYIYLFIYYIPVFLFFSTIYFITMFRRFCALFFHSFIAVHGAECSVNMCCLIGHVYDTYDFRQFESLTWLSN